MNYLSMNLLQTDIFCRLHHKINGCVINKFADNEINLTYDKIIMNDPILNNNTTDLINI